MDVDGGDDTPSLGRKIVGKGVGGIGGAGGQSGVGQPVTVGGVVTVGNDVG